jgi:hypothetical protein
VPTRTTQRLTALAAATLLLAAVTANASARSLSVSEQSFKATWASLEFVGGGATIRCRLTLEGSFHTRTIAKVERSLIGAISRAIFAHPCTNGETWADNGTETEPLGTAPNKLPYHLTYQSFTGTLPAISVVNLLLSRFSYVTQTTILGLTCRGRYGNSTDNIIGEAAREAGGGITSLRPSTAANRTSLVEQLGPNAICPAQGTFGGTATVANLSTGARLTVTLI